MQHNLPSAPGALLGYRKNGTPIRLIAGASEGTPEPPAGNPPSPEPPAPEPSSAPPAADPEPPAQQPPAGTADELPPWAQRELKKLRDEAASNRVKAKEAADAAGKAVEQMRAEQEAQRLALGKALGLVKDEPPTAEELTKQLQASQAERDAERTRARQAAVELAVFRAAGTLGADGSALLDSRSFAGTLADLDPADAGFGERVAAAITAAVEAQPKYKLTPPAPAEPPRPQPTVPQSSPGQFTGPPSTPRQWTEEDVARATPTQLQDAINKGLLENLGFGPKRASRR